MIMDMITMDVSKAILIEENLQPVTIAIDSTHPSPGSGAMFDGIYMDIPRAIKIMLKKINMTLPIRLSGIFRL